MASTPQLFQILLRVPPIEKETVKGWRDGQWLRHLICLYQSPIQYPVLPLSSSCQEWSKRNKQYGAFFSFTQFHPIALICFIPGTTWSPGASFGSALETHEHCHHEPCNPQQPKSSMHPQDQISPNPGIANQDPTISKKRKSKGYLALTASKLLYFSLFAYGFLMSPRCKVGIVFFLTWYV